MLIAIEGIDGSGKATQTRLLQEALAAHGYRAAVLSFPRYGQTIFAQSVTDYLSGRFGDLAAVDPHLAALLYAGDRLESKALIARLRAEHDALVFDRYVASNLAHQAARVAPDARHVFVDWLATIEHDVYGLPRPSLTLYLDVPTSVATSLLDRRPLRSDAPARDLHEASLAHLEQTRQVYETLREASFQSEWRAIACCDGAGQLRPPAAIAAAIWDAVAPTLPPRL